MANLNIKLVKSLNGRLEKHIATANSMGCLLYTSDAADE